MACEIFPDQGSNPCPLQWQEDSYPLLHQESPKWLILFNHFFRGIKDDVALPNILYYELT